MLTILQCYVDGAHLLVWLGSDAVRHSVWWMPQLFNKIEKAFAPKLGYENQNKLAITLPLIREIRGDYKSEKVMVSIIAVDVSPVIKEEAIYE